MIYLDSSAVVKLILDEPGSVAFRDYARERDVISSALTRTEVLRAVSRVASAQLPRAARIVDQIPLMAVDDSILGLAARLDPPTLRSLDAIHLASALALEGDVQAFVSYDDRLVEAATRAGLVAVSPGS